MANNQYANKFVYGNEVKFDISDTTADPSKVLASEKFYDRSGAPQIGACTFDADTSDANATSAEILAGTEQNPITAYVNGNKITGAMPNRGAVTLTIDDKDDELAIANGYHDGSGVAKLDATEKAKLIPSNILQGVTILGVQGSVEPSSDVHIEPSKSVTPSASAQTVLPSSGYDAMAQVVVGAIPYTEVDNPAGGYTITVG